MQRSKSLHENLWKFCTGLVSNCPLPILLGHHSAIPRKVSDGHPKTIKVSMHCQDMKEPNPCHALCLLLWYNMPSSPQLEDGAFEIIEGWPVPNDATFGSSFAVPNSWTGTRDPSSFLKREAPSAFAPWPKKVAIFSLQKSLSKNLQRSHIIHIIPNLFCGSWSLLESRKLLDCELQACLKGVWRRAPAFSLEGWPIKCQLPVSCLWIYRCEPGSSAELRHVQGASLFPDVFSKLDTCTHLDSKHLDLRLLW